MTAKNTAKNLAQVLQAVKSPVELLRNQQTGPNVYPGVPAEYTNWRDEQQAWQETSVLFNQSYHMADLAVEGPDAFKLLSRLSMNSFKNFEPNKAKQFVPCSPDGYVIGDVILFYLAENKFNLVGRAPALNWVTYHAETGKYDVKVELDQRSALRSDGRRKSFRFQVQGPLAMKVIEKVLGKTPPELKFFNMTPLTIAGKTVRALRHGMAGQPGRELFGPWDDGEAVREAVMKAGEEFGLRLVGGRAYSSNALESGWIPSPLPAVYSGDSMKAYREWLPAAGYEAAASIGSTFQKHNRAKFIDWPSAVYSMHPFDRVTADGKTIGVSTWIGYTANEGKMLTLAVLDAEYAEPGTEVVFVWGEENGGSAKPTVERHTQTHIRAIVSPAPYVEVVRKAYAPGGWRKSDA